MSPCGRRAAPWTLLAALSAGVAGAQTQDQDKLDLLARSGVVQGSGARAFGMGGAFLARPDDATAASWNPAGLSYLRLPEVSLVWAGNSLDSPSRDAAGQSTVDDHRNGNAPDFLAGTYPFELGSATGAVQLSYQRAISFDFDRRYDNSIVSQGFDSKGGFDVLALGVGARVSRSLRVGLTVNRWFNGYSQTKDRKEGQRPPTHQTLAFDFSGWNANAGVIWSPWESLNLGAVYKSGFTAGVHMTRTRTDFFADTISVNSYDSHDPNNPLAIRLDFPGAFGFGASWRPADPLTVSADYTRSFWSNGRIANYYTLSATPPTSSPTNTPDVSDSLPYPSLLNPGSGDQRDTVQVRAGVEYLFTWKRLRLPVRAGLFTDSQLFPAQDRSFPRFNGWTVGTGLIVGPVLFDIAYVSESGDYLDPSVEGSTVFVTAHKLYVSLIYRQAQKP